MRLTPSWFRSSSAEPADRSDPNAPPSVTIYHSPHGALSDDTEVTEQAERFIPESNTDLLTVVEEMETPVTVDEITDQLIQPAQPTVETWATVHERLHRHRLPELDASGDILFNEKQGLIKRPSPDSERDDSISSTALRMMPVDSPYVILTLVLSLLSVLIIVFVTTTVVG